MKTLWATATAAVVLAACQAMPVEEPRATAQLQPTKGNKTFGEATFEQVANKVRVVVFVRDSSRAGSTACTSTRSATAARMTA
jgi:hypothetical protein